MEALKPSSIYQYTYMVPRYKSAHLTDNFFNSIDNGVWSTKSSSQDIIPTYPHDLILIHMDFDRFVIKDC